MFGHVGSNLGFDVLPRDANSMDLHAYFKVI